MQIFFYISLFIFGLLFGSFASVLIFRLKTGEGGIFFGRSHCQKCKKTLESLDLIPVFSWLGNFGKCRYCKEKINKIYPLLELFTGIIFCLTGIYLVDFQIILSGNLGEIIKLFFYLILNFITILYIFYDILFLEIHEGIMFSGIFLAFFGNFINSLNSFPLKETLILIILLIIILGIFYLIMLKELKDVYDILLLLLSFIFIFFTYNYFGNLIKNPIFSGIIGAFSIFLFFYLQIFLSRGRALGGGDLRIGIMIGLVLGVEFSLIGIILTYFIGSIIGIFIIGKNFRKKEVNIVPFGPFLGIGFFLTIFYGTQIQNYIENYLNLM